MYIKKCDRCGQQIIYRPETNTIFPIYEIEKICGPQFYSSKIYVDLCTECQKKLSLWLNNDETALNKEIDKLKAENELLKHQIEINEMQQNARNQVIKNSLEYEQGHSFRNIIKKISDKIRRS